MKYLTEYYIADENDNKKELKDYFKNPEEKKVWAKKKEGDALSDFYNLDIEII